MRAPANLDGAVLALSGGVGGAKLALGLSHIVPGEKLIVVANTGDDFEHLNLSISPDLDTLLYTLGGLNNQELGWGRHDESWNFMAALEKIGGETWFRLGDRDLALHVERTRRLQSGESLSSIIDDIRRRFSIGAHIVPMSDDRVRTRITTCEGVLAFQDYFVRRRCEPRVTHLEFVGIADANPHPLLGTALRHRHLRAVVICPSNPLLSIEPILSLPGLRHMLADCSAPVVAVSPIISGRSIKGPTAKMMSELGLGVSAGAALARYNGLLDAAIVDHADAGLHIPGVRIVTAQTLMEMLADKIALANLCLEVADDFAQIAATKDMQ